MDTRLNNLIRTTIFSRSSIFKQTRPFTHRKSHYTVFICLIYPIIPEAINPDWFVATVRFSFRGSFLVTDGTNIFVPSFDEFGSDFWFHVTFTYSIYLLSYSWNRSIRGIVVYRWLKASNSLVRNIRRTIYPRTRSSVILHNTCTRFQSNRRNCSLAISLSSCSPSLGPFAPIDRLP